MARFFSFAPYL